jgi:hypothetical protein
VLEGGREHGVAGIDGVLRVTDEMGEAVLMRHAIVAMLWEAASVSNENVDRAMSMAHKLAIQLRAAEERITQLQGEVQLLAGRAALAERWLETIKQEIEKKLIAPMEANRAEPPVLH